MFGLLQGDSPVKIFHLLDDIFSAMDTDHDSVLDAKEVMVALFIVNKTLDSEYESDILFEKNKQSVSFDKFKNEFASYFNLKVSHFENNLKT